jgi:hypothetical protein
MNINQFFIIKISSINIEMIKYILKNQVVDNLAIEKCTTWVWKKNNVFLQNVLYYLSIINTKVLTHLRILEWWSFKKCLRRMRHKIKVFKIQSVKY